MSDRSFHQSLMAANNSYILLEENFEHLALWRLCLIDLVEKSTMCIWYLPKLHSCSFTNYVTETQTEWISTRRKAQNHPEGCMPNFCHFRLYIYIYIFVCVCVCVCCVCVLECVYVWVCMFCFWSVVVLVILPLSLYLSLSLALSPSLSLSLSHTHT